MKPIQLEDFLLNHTVDPDCWEALEFTHLNNTIDSYSITLEFSERDFQTGELKKTDIHCEAVVHGGWKAVFDFTQFLIKTLEEPRGEKTGVIEDITLKSVKKRDSTTFLCNSEYLKRIRNNPVWQPREVIEDTLSLG